MKNVTKIDRVDLSIFKKTRVAAYCRVSTDSDEQELSLDAQKKHYESYIKSNSEWEYAGIYYDDGISGTKTATPSPATRDSSTTRWTIVKRVLLIWL